MTRESYIKPASCGHLLEWAMIHLRALCGYQKIAKIRYCEDCGKTKGDFTALPGCPKGFNGTSWLLMMEQHPRPPYYFENQNGLIVPEGYKRPATEPEETWIDGKEALE